MRKRTLGTLVPMCLPAALVLYVLSVGPLSWLYARGYFDEVALWQVSALKTYCAPLDWFCEAMPGAKPIVQWYQALWILSAAP